jgi:hypothetical protein
MIEHTPGPWTYRPLPEDSKGTNRAFWVDAPAGSPIADIFDTGDTAEGNAALMAAAPMLLEAARFALEALDNMTTSEFALRSDKEARERLREAIKTALRDYGHEEAKENG